MNAARKKSPLMLRIRGKDFRKKSSKAAPSKTRVAANKDKENATVEKNQYQVESILRESSFGRDDHKKTKKSSAAKTRFGDLPERSDHMVRRRFMADRSLCDSESTSESGSGSEDSLEVEVVESDEQPREDRNRSSADFDDTDGTISRDEYVPVTSITTPQKGYRHLQPWLNGGCQQVIKLYPDEYNEDLFRDVIEKLEETSSFKRMEIYRNEQYGTVIKKRPESDMRSFFATVANVHVSTLVLWHFTEADMRLLRLGSRDRGSPNLIFGVKRIFINFFEGTLSDPVVLDGISCLNSLEKLEVQAKESFDVGRIMKAPNLRWVKVVAPNTAFTEQHISSLCTEIQSRKSQLQFLDLGPRIASSSMQTLLTALANGKSRIHTLRFSYHCEGEKQTDAVMLTIAYMIRMCPSLSKIVNREYSSVRVSRSVKNRLIEVVEDCKNIEHCQLFQTDTSSTSEVDQEPQSTNSNSSEDVKKDKSAAAVPEQQQQQRPELTKSEPPQQPPKSEKKELQAPPPAEEQKQQPQSDYASSLASKSIFSSISEFDCGYDYLSSLVMD